MHNPFRSPAFSMANLTAAINLLPNRYGRMEALNLFPPKPVRCRQILIDGRNGILNLLSTLPLGNPGPAGVRDKRTIRSFSVPQVRHDDVVLAGATEGTAVVGSETETETVAVVLARHLALMRNRHAITLEHLRMGAVKGVILDADGSMLYNLFDEFGIASKAVNFALATGSTDVREKCFEVLRHVGDNLQGEFMTDIHVLCSPEFFEKLVAHPNVEKSYAYYAEGQMLRHDARPGFSFGGLTFEVYWGGASESAGATHRFIAPGEAQAFPVGTADTFGTYVAPADFNETVNTLGHPLYAKQKPRKFERGTDLHTQSNPLPLCRRPGVLVKLTAA